MAKIIVKYNPYKLETSLTVNGREVEKDSLLLRVIKNKRLQEWIGDFPKMLVDELNCVDFDIDFIGMNLDWDDFEYSFNLAKENGILKNIKLNLKETDSDESINEKIVEIFDDLKKGPVEDFRDAKLIRAFESVNNSIFPINVIATMSSGKSTLINSLLSKKLMPSKNEACTATITEILDNDDEVFCAVAYNEKGEEIESVDELTYEIMGKFNDDEKVARVFANGDIPFLDSKTTALMLVDTPGPNNAQNQAHKNTTYQAINSEQNNLILYVLNGTQLSTNDDASLLNYVSEQIKKGGKMVRDRFLFVINKMDSFDPEEEDIAKAVESAKKYLAGYGIEDPQIFPCSAYTALNIRTHLKDIDNIENLTMGEMKKLSSAARDALNAIDKFNDYESMHLEQYSTLSPSAQRDLNYKLQKAEEKGDLKEQALIHCGIYSIEEAIKAYVKKYARTKKIKDLVETFREVLESNKVLANAKSQVASDEEAAKACAERAEAIKEKIDSGKEAEEFKDRIEKLDPVPEINKKADSLKNAVIRKTSKIFEHYGDTITDREEAKRLVTRYANECSDAIASLSADLESIINKEVIDTGEQILIEYQRKLSAIDESATDKHLEFDTVDLIKGALSNMRETAERWCSDSFAAETVESEGEVTYETKTTYEKTGQEEVKVEVGSHEEKVGERQVQTGTKRKVVGTRQVRNPERDGFFKRLAFWKPKYIEEDVYEDVPVYKTEDIVITVKDYETVMRDVFEEKTVQVEKYSVETRIIQSGMTAKLRENLDDGINASIGHAKDQISKMKAQFSDIFNELDKIIKAKYDELALCASDMKEKEAALEHNKNVLDWIVYNQNEIDNILNMK